MTFSPAAIFSLISSRNSLPSRRLSSMIMSGRKNSLPHLYRSSGSSRSAWWKVLNLYGSFICCITMFAMVLSTHPKRSGSWPASLLLARYSARKPSRIVTKPSLRPIASFASVRPAATFVYAASIMSSAVGAAFRHVMAPERQPEARPLPARRPAKGANAAADVSTIERVATRSMEARGKSAVHRMRCPTTSPCAPARRGRRRGSPAPGPGRRHLFQHIKSKDRKEEGRDQLLDNFSYVISKLRLL